MDSAMLLVEAMYLVQQAGNALNFVDHHPRSALQRRDEVREGSWVAAQREEAARIEQVDGQGARESTRQPGGFPRAARAEEQKTVGGRRQQTVEGRRGHWKRFLPRRGRKCCLFIHDTGPLTRRWWARSRRKVDSRHIWAGGGTAQRQLCPSLRRLDLFAELLQPGDVREILRASGGPLVGEKMAFRQDMKRHLFDHARDPFPPSVFKHDAIDGRQ